MDPIVHFEIPFDNYQKAKKFYEEVFGWRIIEIPNMDYYTVITTEIDKQNMPLKSGAINGGLYKRNDQLSKAPVLVIDVKSIDEYLKKIKDSGGALVSPKSAVGDMGFYAQVKDTEGNIIGLWETVPK